MPKKAKANLEFRLVKAEVKGIPEKPSAADDELRLGGAAAQRKFSPGRVDISDRKV